MTAPVVTWEAVLARYADVAPPHWAGVLRVALERYGELVADRLAFAGKGNNADGELPGTEIVRQFLAGTSDIACVGRNKGRWGPALADDVASGAWRTKKYEVRYDEVPPNRNWMTVEAFVEAVGQLPAPAGQPSSPETGQA